MYRTFHPTCLWLAQPFGNRTHLAGGLRPAGSPGGNQRAPAHHPASSHRRARGNRRADSNHSLPTRSYRARGDHCLPAHHTPRRPPQPAD